MATRSGGVNSETVDATAVLLRGLVCPLAGVARAVAHWTVRVFAHGAWRALIPPEAERQVVVCPAGDVLEHVVVTAVDRAGMERAVVVARTPGTEPERAMKTAAKKLARKTGAAKAPLRNKSIR